MTEREPGEREALEEMRAHVDAAHAAAERLVREASRQAEAAAGVDSEDVPPRGWDVPRPAAPDGRYLELQALLGLIELLRKAIPPELAEQFAEAVRQLLIAVSALLDYTIARLDRPTAAPLEVEDIPIQ